MEPRGKLNVPCDCWCSQGSGTVNESLTFVVIIPCNSVSERNEIWIDDYKTMSDCTHNEEVYTKHNLCFTRAKSGSKLFFFQEVMNIFFWMKPSCLFPFWTRRKNLNELHWLFMGSTKTGLNQEDRGNTHEKMRLGNLRFPLANKVLNWKRQRKISGPKALKNSSALLLCSIAVKVCRGF